MISPMPSECIAFLGLGTMGRGMVQNLLRGGYRVRAYNRSPEPRLSLQKELEPEYGPQLECFDSPKLAAQGADLLLFCVSDDDALRAIALGPGSAMDSITAQSLCIDCGTTSQSLTQSLASSCHEKGASFLDAPITGSKLGAAGGKLTFMVGGPKSAVERARPVLDCMGAHLVHVAAEVGAGQAAKYCLNMTQAVVLQGILEGYALAQKQGVPLAKMAEIFEKSAGKTGVGSFKTPYLQQGDYRPHFRLDLMQKDLHLALERAEQYRLPLPAAQSVRLLYDQGVAEGWGDQDFLVLAKLLERWGKLDFSQGG